MNERIRHLLPNDRLKIFQKEPFYEDAETVLTLLYQPLISIKGIAVYQALWKESAYQQPQTSISHHQMMNTLNMTLDDFYEARKKLEAIGLLQSYKEEGTYRTLYYLLQKPYSAQGFFSDPMLSALLEHHIGRDAYQRLKKRLINDVQLPSNAQRVTHSFDDVFTTINPDNIPQEPVMEETSPGAIETKLPIEWLYKMLTQQQIKAQSILTQSNLDFMEKMIKIYDVDFLELEKAVIWAVNEQQQFDRKEFQDMCKDIFYKKHGSVPPRLYSKGQSQPENTQPEQKNQSDEPQTKEEQLIQRFNTVSHRELLEDLSASGRASMKEVDMLTTIMEEHGLSQPVMNVLVDYVLKRNQNKLSKNFIETIAAHWGREGITQAKEAMQIAKREHHMYETWKQKKSQNQNPKRQQRSKEVLPKWFQDERKQKKQTSEPTKKPENQQDTKKKREELEAFIKSYSKTKH